MRLGERGHGRIFSARLPLVGARPKLRLPGAMTSRGGRHIEKLATLSGGRENSLQRAAGFQRLRTRVCAAECPSTKCVVVCTRWSLELALCGARRNRRTCRTTTFPLVEETALFTLAPKRSGVVCARAARTTLLAAVPSADYLVEVR